MDDPAEEDADLRAAVAGELHLLDPEIRRRPEEAGRLLHRDFAEFGASGRIWDREPVLEAMAADPGSATETQHMHGLRLAPGVVLLTYRVSGTEGTTLRSSVWRRDDEGWQLVFHQGTRRDARLD